MSTVIRGGRVVLPDGRIECLDVLVVGSVISAVGQRLDGSRQIDAADCYVLPGIIDLHTHGIGNVSALDDCLSEMAQIASRNGCTTFYPTFFAPPEELIDSLIRHRRETSELRLTPTVGGFRLESPYLARTGGGMSRDLAQISRDLSDRLLLAGGGHIRIWDIAPELPGAAELISRLAGEGIVCSIAHTQASIEQGRAAIDAGASLVTHLFDTFVVPEMTEPGAYPAGLVDYLLIEDRVVCEIIGDGLHVHPILVEKALRCKTPHRIAFITDSNRGAGLSPGRYSLGAWGDVVVNGPNDGIRLADRGMMLAGSALTPIAALYNAVKLFGQNLYTASLLCSRTPARLMGLNKGEIAPGKDADVVILSPDLEVRCTISLGDVVYNA